MRTGRGLVRGKSLRKRWMFEDRRKQVRYPCLLTGEARPAGAAPFEVVCTSISRGGAFFTCKKPMAPHTQLTILLRPSGYEGVMVECLAEVAWTSPRGAMTPPGFGAQLRLMSCAAGDDALRAFAAEHLRWADLAPLPEDGDGRAWLRWDLPAKTSGVYAPEEASSTESPITSAPAAVRLPRPASGGHEVASSPAVVQASAAVLVPKTAEAIRVPPSPHSQVLDPTAGSSSAPQTKSVPESRPKFESAVLVPRSAHAAPIQLGAGPSSDALSQHQEAALPTMASAQADEATLASSPAVLGWVRAGHAVAVPNSAPSAPFPSMIAAARPTPTTIEMPPVAGDWPATDPALDGRDPWATQPIVAPGSSPQPTVGVAAPSRTVTSSHFDLPPAGQPQDTIRQPVAAPHSQPGAFASAWVGTGVAEFAHGGDQRPSAPRAIRSMESGGFVDDLPGLLAPKVAGPAGAERPTTAAESSTTGRQHTHPGVAAPLASALSLTPRTALPASEPAVPWQSELIEWNDATNPELLLSALAMPTPTEMAAAVVAKPTPSPAIVARTRASQPSEPARVHAAPATTLELQAQAKPAQPEKGQPQPTVLDERTFLYGRTTGNFDPLAVAASKPSSSQVALAAAVPDLPSTPVFLRRELAPALDSWPAGVPRNLGSRYNHLQVLGQGGHGVVYRARDTMLERHVVLKLLVQSTLGSDVARRYFQREVKLAASLNHPNIVHVYDVGEAEGVLWYTMEFVDGVPLSQYLVKGQPLTDMGFLYSVFSQLCEALDHAHGQGILHRDVKPENVLVATDGTVKLFDFGLARAADQGFGEQSLLLGTPHYMAPEQLSGGAITAATDAYALGVLLYRLVAGEVPFREGNVFAAHVLEPVPDPRLLVPSISPTTVAILMKLLAKQPDQRYTNCRQPALDLWPALFAAPK